MTESFIKSITVSGGSGGYAGASPKPGKRLVQTIDHGPYETRVFMDEFGRYTEEYHAKAEWQLQPPVLYFTGNSLSRNKKLLLIKRKQK